MKKSYLYFLFAVVLTGIGILVYSTLKSKDAFSENLIISLSVNLEKELASYFNPVREEFNKITENYQAYSGDLMNEDSLSARLIPVISGIPAIGAVSLYNNKGHIYSIYREKNTFVSSLENLGEESASLVWSRRMMDNSISSNWTEVLIGQEGRIEVVQNILDGMATDDESVIWTGIYQSRQLKEPVITAAVDWVSGLDSSVFICSFEMPVRIMIRHLNSFNKFKNRRIFMAMTSGQLIDIPDRVSDSIGSLEDQFKGGFLQTIQDSILLSFINSWQQIGGNMDMTYHQQLDGNDWWIHIRDFSDYEKIAAVGLAMPEGSLKIGLIKSYSSIILVITFLLLSVLIYFVSIAKRKRTSNSSGPDITSKISNEAAMVSDPPYTADNEEVDWKAMISKGENQSVEFKSALRMDMNQGKVNTGLENVIVKSLAAFSNGDGGILIIGVRDDGSILGLDGDLSTLKKQDSDYFEIHLRNLLKQQFGVTFITRNIKVQFPKLEDKEICVITINKGGEPVYVTHTDKNGNKSERFYVRSGNSSQEIQSLKEINEYISQRF